MMDSKKIAGYHKVIEALIDAGSFEVDNFDDDTPTINVQLNALAAILVIQNQMLLDLLVMMHERQINLNGKNNG